MCSKLLLLADSSTGLPLAQQQVSELLTQFNFREAQSFRYFLSLASFASTATSFTAADCLLRHTGRKHPVRWLRCLLWCHTDLDTSLSHTGHQSSAELVTYKLPLFLYRFRPFR